jgi:sugar (pentulose or hexulose) kinase
MYATPVIAIFDIGKTNKKLFLFDEDYNIVYEESTCFAEVTDEDGDACESLESLQSFVISSLQKVFQNKAFTIRAVNFATYGASFVHLNANGKPVTPLYNYLKVYPKELLQQFYDTYGSEATIFYCDSISNDGTPEFGYATLLAQICKATPV